MTDHRRGSAFIFVGGAARSGTTMLQNMLDAHPAICGAPEFHHLPEIGELRRKLHASIDCEEIDLFCSHDDVDQYFSRLIEELLLPLKEKHDRAYLSEKTPENVLVFSDLIELFPAAHFICIVRDPRAVIASMLQVGRRGRGTNWVKQDFTRSVLAAITYVKKCLKAAMDAKQKAPDRVAIVSYERLVHFPEVETQGLCSFLGLTWSKQMLHPASIKHLGEKSTTARNIWYDSVSYNRDPQTTGVDKWKTELSVLQQAMIVTAFRDDACLASFGYDLSIKGPLGRSLSLGARLVQAARRAAQTRRSAAAASARAAP